MNLPRREFLSRAASVAALPMLTRSANAQAYPAKPVRLLVGYPAGGVVDIYARFIAQLLSERLGQSFIIENRAGAAGTLAVDATARAPADGYTLLLGAGNDSYNELIYPDVKFNYARDITPVAGIAFSSCVMAVNRAFPAKTLAEFIAYGKANPGKINFASAGIGTTQHLSGELFKLLTGIDMVHIAYRGGAPAVSDLLAGQVQVMFEFTASALPHVQSGSLRAIGVTKSTRLAALPDVPAVGEFLTGFESGAWFGLVAPKRIPANIVDTINREINLIIGDPKVKARIADLGGEALPGSPAEFAKVVAMAAEKWAKVIKTAGIKAG